MKNKLRTEITIFLVFLFITNAIVIIGFAPSKYDHPIEHFLCVVLGLANLFGIALYEYVLGFDYRKKM